MSEQFSGPQGKIINIPNQASVFWSLASQSAGIQRLQIRDPSGNVIVDTSVLSTSLSNTSTGTFMTGNGGNYTVIFPSDQTVMYDSASINTGRTIVSETSLFAAEDSTDNDYNDAFVTLTWFGKNG